MAQTQPTDPNDAPVTRLTRVIRAPRAAVFAAWTKAEHIRNWFAPEVYSVPEARIEPHAGGAFEVLMRGPGGIEHWTRGTFRSVEPIDRLAIDMRVDDGNGDPIFLALTEVTFLDVSEGTRIDVVQTYDVRQPHFAMQMLQGAAIGWTQTVDKLEREVARMLASGWKAAEARIATLAGQQPAPGRSVVHGIFHIERLLAATPARIYAAFTDPEAKVKWFAAPSGEWTTVERSMDVRVGGKERLRGRWQNGTITDFDATYLDLVPDARLVYTYTMHIDERKISVSLATIEINPSPDGRTKLRVTEQGAFLDGYDDAGAREHGTNVLIDQLVASLP